MNSLQRNDTIKYKKVYVCMGHLIAYFGTAMTRFYNLKMLLGIEFVHFSGRKWTWEVG